MTEPRPFPLKASLGSARSRAAGSTRRDAVTVVGPATWRASLISSQRGQLVTRQADTREAAIAVAHLLLDEAADFAWLHGEVVGVRVEQDAG